MENNICKFCGQMLMGDVECDCKEAQQERRVQDLIQRSQKAVVEIFGEGSKKQECVPIPQECIEFIYLAIEQIAYSKIYSLTLTLPNGTKAKLTRSKGDIKIERSETKKICRSS